MLSGGVGVGTHAEPAQHLAADGPRPRETRIWEHQRSENQPEYENTTQSPPPVLATGNAMNDMLVDSPDVVNEGNEDSRSLVVAGERAVVQLLP